ncbi:hypothetical protein QBC44DRAFT_320153 [Cladorrhinum sp. PSN332]|nr:hypothetical protein QBC44DRAFT_320153 [Cladorrhinum sp. PSN332]
MALQAAYKQFLAAPNQSALAPSASLHYITSTTSYNGPGDIIKHLNTARNQIKKNKEDVLFVIEGQNAVVLEAELSVEFVTGAGGYLPGLDDNFIADRTVTFQITHIVTFDDNGKITQIRQSWDQGALLKQLDVIGKSGRNWPIRDSKEQINLITKCVKGGGAPSAVDNLPIHNRAKSTNILRDPHASLALFAPREELEEAPAVVSPYAGRRPTQRSLTEILGDEDEEPGSPSNGRERSKSPNKAIAPKIGAGKNFQPVRLFDKDDNAADADTPEKGQSPERYVRPNPKKYQHFDFDDGHTEPPLKPSNVQPKKTKHNNNWDFEDFVTPQKPKANRTLHPARDVRHWDAENGAAAETPAQKAQVAKGRRQAESHFDFVDDGPTPAAGRHVNPSKARGIAQGEGQHLYDENLYYADGSIPTPAPALGNITNLGGRHKTFDPHFGMTDESPVSNGPKAQAKIGEDRQKAVRMMESNWEAYDVSPSTHKENSNPNSKPKRTGDERGIVTAGDGMGGKKGTARWAFGEDGDDQPAPPVKKAGRGPPQPSDSFWDF